MILLGIESSCDETAAAVVNSEREILSNIVRSQISDHSPFGGVVPEIAARNHLEHIDKIIHEAMKVAKIDYGDLDGIAATAGPGLIGAVMVGLMTGKSIATAHKKPFIALNHLEGHALSPRLIDKNLQFPYLLLLVSGGHCQLVIVYGVGNYRRLGTTIDDAPGEAFDKVAKLINLGYPGGPEIEKKAKLGDAKKYKLPRPLNNRPGCNFSFSGLKTAVLHLTQKLDDKNLLSQENIYDIAASFQHAVSDVLVNRTRNAISEYKSEFPQIPYLVVAGGVAANSMIRQEIKKLAEEEKIGLIIPDQSLCTDNGAMIAWGGIERLDLGLIDDTSAPPRARWPLDPNAIIPEGMGTPGKLGIKG